MRTEKINTFNVIPEAEWVDDMLECNILRVNMASRIDLDHGSTPATYQTVPDSTRQYQP